jgi:hypothetical protein
LDLGFELEFGFIEGEGVLELRKVEGVKIWIWIHGLGVSILDLCLMVVRRKKLVAASEDKIIPRIGIFHNHSLSANIGEHKNIT